MLVVGSLILAPGCFLFNFYHHFYGMDVEFYLRRQSSVRAILYTRATLNLTVARCVGLFEGQRGATRVLAEYSPHFGSWLCLFPLVAQSSSPYKSHADVH